MNIVIGIIGLAVVVLVFFVAIVWAANSYGWKPRQVAMDMKLTWLYEWLVAMASWCRRSKSDQQHEHYYGKPYRPGSRHEDISGTDHEFPSPEEQDRYRKAFQSDDKADGGS